MWNSFYQFQFVPLFIAPNLLTFSGFLLLLLSFAVMTFYDPHFYAASRDYPEHSPIPNWVWLMGAANNFLSHTLGKECFNLNLLKMSSPTPPRLQAHA